jgi:hypothetical protein
MSNQITKFAADGYTRKEHEIFERWAVTHNPPYMLELNQWRLGSTNRWYKYERTWHAFEGFVAARRLSFAYAKVNKELEPAT